MPSLTLSLSLLRRLGSGGEAWSFPRIECMMRRDNRVLRLD